MCLVPTLALTTWFDNHADKIDAASADRRRSRQPEPDDTQLVDLPDSEGFGILGITLVEATVEFDPTPADDSARFVAAMKPPALPESHVPDDDAVMIPPTPGITLAADLPASLHQIQRSLRLERIPGIGATTGVSTATTTILDATSIVGSNSLDISMPIDVGPAVPIRTLGGSCVDTAVGRVAAFSPFCEALPRHIGQHSTRPIC